MAVDRERSTEELVEAGRRGADYDFDLIRLLIEKDPDHAFEGWAVESVANLARTLTERLTSAEERYEAMKRRRNAQRDLTDEWELYARKANRRADEAERRLEIQQDRDAALVLRASEAERRLADLESANRFDREELTEVGAENAALRERLERAAAILRPVVERGEYTTKATEAERDEARAALRAIAQAEEHVKGSIAGMIARRALGDTETGSAEPPAG